jgi:hypothetical protein
MSIWDLIDLLNDLAEKYSRHMLECLQNRLSLNLPTSIAENIFGRLFIVKEACRENPEGILLQLSELAVSSKLRMEE